LRNFAHAADRVRLGRNVYQGPSSSSQDSPLLSEADDGRKSAYFDTVVLPCLNAARKPTMSDDVLWKLKLSTFYELWVHVRYRA
jgi:hypothetical protein